MKILVTGSNGFVGKHLVRALTRENFNVLEFDIDNSFEDLKRYINECDFIVHLAGINRPLSVEEFYNGNSNLTKTVVDLVKGIKKDIPIVISSSIQAALDNDYGKSKKMAEDYLFESGLSVYVFRLANVFGKWCKPNYNSAAATFMFNIANNLPIQIRDRDYVVHYNFVEDIINTFIKCIRNEIHPSKEILYVQPTFDCSLGHLADLLYTYKNVVESDEHLPKINNEFEYDLFISFLDYLSDSKYSFNYAKDDRGSFEEIYKSEKHGQISINKSNPGITKGGHYHTYKKEMFMTVKGKCITRQRKIDSSEIDEYIQDGKDDVKVNIKPGYTHDIKNVGDDESITLMWISEIYKDETADTYRLEVEKND